MKRIVCGVLLACVVAGCGDNSPKVAKPDKPAPPPNKSEVKDG